MARLIDDLAHEFFNQAIDGVIQNNPKARANPKALAQLDGYKRPLVFSIGIFSGLGGKELRRSNRFRKLSLK